MSLLSEIEELLFKAPDWDHVYKALEKAFVISNENQKAITSIKFSIDIFREGNKTLTDVYNLFEAIKAIPWAAQKALLTAKENSDIAEALKGCTEESLGRLIFKDKVATGAKLLEDVGFTDKAVRLCKIDQQFFEITETWKTLKIKLNKAEHSRKYDTYIQLPTLRRQLEECEAKKKELISKRDGVLNEAQKAVLGIKNKLLQKSDISQEEADFWVEYNINIDTPAIATLIANKKRGNEEGVTIDVIKKELANIYRITNGKLPHINIRATDDGSRSWANRDKQEIQLGNARLDSLYHEAGHHFEYKNRDCFAAAKQFIEDRASGSAKSLYSLTGNKFYDYDEKAYPDNFSDPYVGKVYRHASTEVLSMGLEALGGAESLLRGIRDMEHLKFCFGCFASKAARKIEGPVAYTVNSDARIYSYTEKQKAWHEAIDASISDSFAQQLYGAGVWKYRIEKDEHGTLRLKHNSKVIDWVGNPKGDEFKFILRLAYAAICNFKKLVPEANPKLENKFVDLEHYVKYPPSWFTPFTELPRL